MVAILVALATALTTHVNYQHDVIRFTNIISIEQVAPPPAAHTHTPEWSIDWDALAYCESTGRWDYNGDSGFMGGLQFHPKTWTWLKPDGYPEFAWQATKEQQITVAEITLAEQGLEAWPACTKKMGLR